MTTVVACIYFDSDQSVAVLSKSKCVLRSGPFIEGAEVEVDWRGENGERQRHIGLVLVTKGKDKKGLLDDYAQYVSQQIKNWVEEGKRPRNELCHLKSIDNFTRDAVEDHYDEKSTKRKRKITEKLKESKEQERNSGEDAAINTKRLKTLTNQPKGPENKQKSQQKTAKPNKKSEETTKKGKENKTPASAQCQSNIEACQEMLECMPELISSFPPSDIHKKKLSKATTVEVDRTSSTEDNSDEILSIQSYDADHEDDQSILQIIEDNLPPKVSLAETVDVISDAMATVREFAASEAINLGNVGGTEYAMEKENDAMEMSVYKKRIAHLEDENKRLLAELEDLKGKKPIPGSHSPPAPSVEVLQYFETVLSHYQGTQLLNKEMKPVEKYTIQAHLTPAKFPVKQEAQVKLLADYNVFVNREKLRSILHNANSKGPIHLIGRLVSIVFSQEELAQSCGQGLHKTLESVNKPPLDGEKLSACKEYMTAYCIQNNKSIPSPKEVNMAITAQVTYARVKSKDRKKPAVERKM